MDRDVLLLDEELHEEALEPGVGVPVELAQVVAGGVVAVVGELNALPSPHAAALTLHPPGGQPARGELELLEAAQERLVEERCALGGGHAFRQRASSRMEGNPGERAQQPLSGRILAARELWPTWRRFAWLVLPRDAHSAIEWPLCPPDGNGAIARSRPVKASRGTGPLLGRFGGRLGDDRANDRVGADALGLALEVEDDPVAQRRGGHGLDVVVRRR